MNIIEANVATPDARVAITIARFNNFINDSLLEGAIDALKRIGQVKDENITVVWVPGAYELPLAAGALAKTGKYDAVIALGTVIRGGTATLNMWQAVPAMAWRMSLRTAKSR